MKFTGTQWTLERTGNRVTLTLAQALGGMECTTRMAFAPSDQGAQMLLDLVGELQSRFQPRTHAKRGRKRRKRPTAVQDAPMPLAAGAH